MYRKEQYTEKTLENFKNLFEGKLDEENRWIKMSKMIPWEEFEGEYAKNFKEEKGAPAKSFRRFFWLCGKRCIIRYSI
jgi:hypothetical protein